MILVPAVIVGGHLVVAVADRPPVVNFERTCREAASGGTRMNDKFEICVADEKRAREQLARQWDSFDSAARTRCARTSTAGPASSYIELLTCLEMDQTARKVHGPDSTGEIMIMAPESPVDRADEAAVPNRSGRIPQPREQSAAAVPPPTSGPPPLPAPVAPPPVSQGEVLEQSLCRSLLGWMLPTCR